MLVNGGLTGLRITCNYVCYCVHRGRYGERREAGVESGTMEQARSLHEEFRRSVRVHIMAFCWPCLCNEYFFLALGYMICHIFSFSTRMNQRTKYLANTTPLCQVSELSVAVVNLTQSCNWCALTNSERESVLCPTVLYNSSQYCRREWLWWENFAGANFRENATGSSRRIFHSSNFLRHANA